ncbi:energy-coupling factor transporter ATPase [Oscillospiraceae bacterium OttesenSCG-928-F05]|nr:energy-coupling factor transporter ATPase [Oscillospiraceae bacterium OttesenSCG-928-F05]
MTDDVIRAEALSFRYHAQGEGTPPVLDDVTLSVKKGELVALLGHNGSGKSTFAKHMNAVALPVGGRMLVAGMDTADEALLFDIRQTVGMVFQNPDNQLVANIVEEDVAFAPENLGVPPDEIRARVDEALKTVGMYDYKTHAPHMLSGGQKQRIAIAGVLAMMPECIVFDEPTAMLDPRGRSEVMETILKLNREGGVTIVLITHHMDEAALCGRVVVMGHGKIVMDGAPERVFSEVDALRAIGLSVPQTVELMDALRKENIEVPLDALSVDACAGALAALLR